MSSYLGLSGMRDGWRRERKTLGGRSLYVEFGGNFKRIGHIYETLIFECLQFIVYELCLITFVKKEIHVCEKTAEL